VVTLAALLANVVERTPLRQTSQGYSGATLERLVLADGQALVVKRLSPTWDATMRLTHDTGRAAWLWTAGVMDQFPPVIDHAIVAAEPTEDGWVIVMRDISGALLPDDRVLTRAESRRILEAAAALHRTFRSERIEGLCRLGDHLSLFSPRTPGSLHLARGPPFAGRRARMGSVPLCRAIRRGGGHLRDP
jgi:hypothetical protein